MRALNFGLLTEENFGYCSSYSRQEIFKVFFISVISWVITEAILWLYLRVSEVAAGEGADCSLEFFVCFFCGPNLLQQ